VLVILAYQKYFLRIQSVLCKIQVAQLEYEAPLVMLLQVNEIVSF
jgi:hypothetical protein